MTISRKLRPFSVHKYSNELKQTVSLKRLASTWVSFQLTKVSYNIIKL